VGDFGSVGIFWISPHSEQRPFLPALSAGARMGALHWAQLNSIIVFGSVSRSFGGAGGGVLRS
jgi:hypothetical protein